jgi:hypothetical protein
MKFRDFQDNNSDDGKDQDEDNEDDTAKFSGTNSTSRREPATNSTLARVKSLTERSRQVSLVKIDLRYSMLILVVLAETHW